MSKPRQVPPDEYPDGLDPAILGGRIREACGGRSQRWLAEALDVDPSTVSDWKTGKHRPSRAHLAAIAEATGKPFAFFTGAALVACCLAAQLGLHCPADPLGVCPTHVLIQAEGLLSITAQLVLAVT